MRPPFFVVGAPRSGTTFLVGVLDHHENVFLTNETRVFTFLSRSRYGLGQDRFALMTERRAFLRVYEQHMRAVVEDFYHGLGVRDDQAWGDKFPHYADARTDPRCLELIDRTFPASRFVHLLRDGRDVVSSLVAKGWADLDEAANVWVRHVTHARDFGTRVGLDRYHEVRYEDLVTRGVTTVRHLESFLGVGHSPAVGDFVESQQEKRTPFSKPMSDGQQLGEVATWRARLSGDQADRAMALLGPTLEEFGYHDHLADVV